MKEELQRLLKMIAMGRPDAVEPLAELLASKLGGKEEPPTSTVVLEVAPTKRKKAQ